MSNVIIRKAIPDDVEYIVSIHQEAFKTFFLTNLGEHFLVLYYKTFIKSNLGIVYCAEKEKHVVGFAACSYRSRGFNMSLIKNNIILYCAEAMRLLFTQPKSLYRLFKNLNKHSSDIKFNDEGKYAELYSIAVSPSCQGEGVGRLLLNDIELDVMKYNDQISLTTDQTNNHKVISFYHSLNYTNLYEFTTYPNRKMWRMIKRLK